MEEEELKKILGKAGKWLAVRDRCERELRQKLRDWEVPAENLEPLTDQLKSLGFIDDERFAMSFVSGHLKMKGWGKNKIKSALFQKGISESLINKSLLEFENEDWKEALDKAIAKAYRSGHSSVDYQAKQKLVRHLMGKGFSYDEIAARVKSNSGWEE